MDDNKKIKRRIKSNPGQSFVNLDGALYCNCCELVIKHHDSSTADKHAKANKHVEALKLWVLRKNKKKVQSVK